jgi:hypothetical protein
MICVFGEKYLRASNEEDTKSLMDINEARGWPGMLGSIDYMQWTCKNFLTAWHNHHRGPTIVLEAGPRRISGFGMLSLAFQGL